MSRVVGKRDGLSAEERLYAQVIKSLHETWYPHPGQIPLIQAVFRDNIKFAFVRCGRKWGKSEVCTYLCWRWALSHPGSTVYYLGPEYKQIKEIMWANRRMEAFVDPAWVSDVRQDETRLVLINQSFIKIDGSNNYEAYRGINPHFIVLDEFAQHDPRFIEVMWPNLASYDAPIVMIGTPPADYILEDGTDHQYVQYQKDAEHMAELGQAYYIHAPSSQNTNLPEGWLDRERARLIRRDEEWLWRREYLAEYVRGGENLIFPMFDRDVHVQADARVQQMAFAHREELRLFVIVDPGTASTFAVLFLAFNPHTQQIFVLDEIYERRTARTSTRQIYDRIVERIERLTGPYSIGRWTRIFDSAAAWFSVEMESQFGLSFAPCLKSERSKEDGISLMKDIFLFDGVLLVSDLCTSFALELERYKTDENGRIIERGDHLIDCFRYFLRWINFKFKNVPRPHDRPLVERRRAYRIEDDFKRARRQRDWTQGILEKY